MRLNKFLNYALGAGVLSLTACASEGYEPDSNTDGTDPKVYVSFSIVNTDTRSITGEGDDNYGQSDSGVEYGTNVENTINDVKLFLVNSDGDGKAVAASAEFQHTSDMQLYYTAAFKDEDIKGYAGQNVKVIVFCNMPDLDVTTYDKNTVRTGQSWGNGNAGDFQMSNANGGFDITFSVPSNTELSKYDSPENPLSLGAFNVKRAAARFDIKAYGTYVDGGTVKDNCYKIDGNDDIYIELTDLALVNMSKNWYALQRVSNNADGSNTTICGSETRNNYIIDTDWQFKKSWTGGISTATNYEFLSSSADNNERSWTKLSTLTSEDNDNSWNSSNTYGDYKVWRYANENTMPDGAQRHALSTGVVYRGALRCIASSGALSDAMTAQKDLYVFRNKLYGSWEMVETAAEADGALVALQVAVDQSYEMVDGVATFNQALAKNAGFQVYTYNENLGFYDLYYYYWNRHNDNGNPSVMGPMEFAVVRNNVYKLCVTDIHLFGHSTSEDPDDPDTPDEQNEVYFTVSLKVMPWIVRINNIEF